MEYLPRTYSVLSVAAAEKFHTSLRELLPAGRYSPVRCANDASEARRCILESRYDIIVISAPLRDEFGSDLACHIAETTAAGVVLLVKAEHVAEINAKVEPSGVFVLEKPVSRSMFQYIMRMMSAMERRMAILKRENVRLQNKIEETRMVNRAKLVLMECLKMSEENAHYYIEHQAMNMRCTKMEIAQSIIRTYKN